MDPSAETMQQFYRDLATMLELSTPLVTALELVSEQIESSALAGICPQLVDQIMGGTDFAEALSEFPDIFPNRVVGMIRLGEQQVLLTEQIDLVAEGYQKQFLGNESESEYDDLALVFSEIALFIDDSAPAISLTEAFECCGRICEGWASDSFVDSFYLVSDSFRCRGVPKAIPGQRKRK